MHVTALSESVTSQYLLHSSTIAIRWLWKGEDGEYKLTIFSHHLQIGREPITLILYSYNLILNIYIYSHSKQKPSNFKIPISENHTSQIG